MGWRARGTSDKRALGSLSPWVAPVESSRYKTSRSHRMDVDDHQAGYLPAFRYDCTSISIDGLPTRRFFEREGKYFLRIIIDGEGGWQSRVVKTKGSRVVWDEEQDRCVLACRLTSVLRLVLYKTHIARPKEEVAWVEGSIKAWLGFAGIIPLTMIRNPNLKSSVRALIRMQATAPNNPPEDRQELLHVPESAARSSMRDDYPPEVNAEQYDTDIAQEWKVRGVENVETWQPLLERVHWFMKAMVVEPVVQPYARTAWTVLGAAYKVVNAQQARGGRVMELVDSMKTTYEVICHALELGDVMKHPGFTPPRVMALARISAQTIECAHFISTYAKDHRFLSPLLKQTGPRTNDAIGQYIESFQKTKDAFMDGSSLGMELVTFRMLGKLETADAKLDLRQIPYVSGATYDSAKFCLPGTRIKLLEELTGWANSDHPDTPTVLFLMGPAGTGKSAIAHTLASRFDATNQLGSMFCFSTSEHATRTPTSVFRNMAHDLCEGCPAFLDALASSVGGDWRTCGTYDPELQVAKFILEPARNVLLSGTILLIIEALDESGTERDREKLLSMLVKQLPQLPAGFRVLITCRPEPDILATLTPPPPGVTQYRMPSINEETSLAEDVRLYIRHELSRGSEKLPVGLDDDDCEELVERAEGLFQWAFVACNYINGETTFGDTVRDRCRRLLQGERATDGLDSLYKAVLEERLRKNPDAAVAFRITLGMLLMAVEPLTMQSLIKLIRHLPEDLLPSAGIAPETILPRLAALLSGVTQIDEPVRPLHTSFREFLCDEQRGGHFYIGRHGHHERLLISCLALLNDRLHFNMGRFPTSYISNAELLSAADRTAMLQQDLIYACKHWGFHLDKCVADIEKNTNLVRGLVEQLMLKNLLFWIEATSIAGAMLYLDASLSFALESLRIIGGDVAPMVWEAIRFLRRFGPVLGESAPHLYSSALAWCPSDSQLVQYYRPAFLNTPRILPEQFGWPALDFSLSGHKDGVTSIAFSGDGTRIVSASRDGTLRVWNAFSGELVGHPFGGYEMPVTSVAFSPDGARLVSGSHDNTLRLWDAITGKCIWESITGHTNGVTSVGFSPDGTSVVSGSGDRTIRMWNATTGEPMGEPLTGHTRVVNAVAFSPDGTRIVSSSADYTVRVWNAATGKVIGEPLYGHLNVARSVAWSSDGTRLVSGSQDHSVRLWNAVTGDAIGEPFIGHTDAVSSVAFSPDGTRIVSGSWDNTVRMWNTTTGEDVGEPLTGHIDAVTAVAFSPDGTRVASGSSDRTVRIWHANGLDMRLPSTLEKHNPAHDVPDSSRMWDAIPEVISLPSFSLSSRPEHQVQQPYFPEAMEEAFDFHAMSDEDEAWERASQSSSTSSSHREPQTKQPSAGHDAARSHRITLNYRTGWILGNGRDRLLWVPPDMMQKLYVCREQLGLPGPAIDIDLSRFRHGTRWTEVFEEDLMPSVDLGESL